MTSFLIEGGVWIDAYNQCVNTEVAGTILTRVDAANHYFVTEPIATNERTYSNPSGTDIRPTGKSDEW